jgi:hypothetical protein
VPVPWYPSARSTVAGRLDSRSRQGSQRPAGGVSGRDARYRLRLHRQGGSSLARNRFTSASSPAADPGA